MASTPTPFRVYDKYRKTVIDPEQHPDASYHAAKINEITKTFGVTHERARELFYEGYAEAHHTSVDGVRAMFERRRESRMNFHAVMEANKPHDEWCGDCGAVSPEVVYRPFADDFLCPSCAGARRS